MSKTTCTYPIVGCTTAAQEYLGLDKWVPKTDAHHFFLDRFHVPGSKEVGKLKEVETRVSKNAKELNAWFKERGFNIQLEDFNDPADFGVGSIMDVLVKFAEKGKRTTIMKDPGYSNDKYDAVQINEDNCRVFTTANHPHPIVELATQSKEKVFLTVATKPVDGFELPVTVQALEAKISGTRPDSEWEDGVIFPMVDLDQGVDIDWLIGMAIGDFRIAQAKQQTKFKMNEEGARAESAAALGFECLSASISKGPVVINKPFLVWITRPNLSAPFFAGYITQEDWKDPKTLGK